MGKPKCANCGNEMIEAYTRTGLKLLICGYVKARTVKKLSGTPVCSEICCSINVKGLRQSFEKLTENTKLTIEALRSATRYTISDSVLLEQANLALMLELPANELATLFKAAFDLGLSLGLKPEKAIESLSKGVGRQSRLILDNIGIVFKANEAYEWFRSEHNLDKIDSTQKREAWQTYAIRLVKQKAEALNQ